MAAETGRSTNCRSASIDSRRALTINAAEAITANCPSSTPTLKPTSDAARRSPDRTQIGHRAGETQAVQQTEHEHDEQPPACDRSHEEILERDEGNRGCDQRLDDLGGTLTAPKAPSASVIECAAVKALTWSSNARLVEAMRNRPSMKST
jgi:hypothetical protein